MEERAAPWLHLSSSSCSSALTILSCPSSFVGRRRRLKIQRTEEEEEMVMDRKASQLFPQCFTMKICKHTGKSNYTVNILLYLLCSKWIHMGWIDIFQLVKNRKTNKSTKVEQNTLL